MSRNEAQSRLDLVDPCLIDQRGWPCANIRVDATAAAVNLPVELPISSTPKARKPTPPSPSLRDLVGQQTPKSNVSLKHP
jgi:hypothetical protein